MPALAEALSGILSQFLGTPEDALSTISQSRTDRNAHSMQSSASGFSPHLAFTGHENFDSLHNLNLLNSQHGINSSAAVRAHNYSSFFDTTNNINESTNLDQIIDGSTSTAPILPTFSRRRRNVNVHGSSRASALRSLHPTSFLSESPTFMIVNGITSKKEQCLIADAPDQEGAGLY